MTILKATTAVVLGLLAGAGALHAQDQSAEPVVRLNALTYQAGDADIQKRWDASPLKGKALVQGLKFDSAGDMYVTTARWGGADIPATVSKLVKAGDGYALQPFPSQALNDVGNPDGLKAVLGFEIDENDVMWILDQGHGTDAVTRLLIETTDGESSWVTVGVGANVIEASWGALVDGVTFGLRRHGLPQHGG